MDLKSRALSFHVNIFLVFVLDIMLLVCVYYLYTVLEGVNGYFEFIGDDSLWWPLIYRISMFLAVAFWMFLSVVVTSYLSSLDKIKVAIFFLMPKLLILSVVVVYGVLYMKDGDVYGAGHCCFYLESFILKIFWVLTDLFFAPFWWIGFSRLFFSVAIFIGGFSGFYYVFKRSKRCN